MDGRRLRWVPAASAVFAIGACGPRPLDPNGGGTGTVPTSSDDIATLGGLSGPGALLIVASNAGVVIGPPDGDVHWFEKDPGTLVGAAATVGMRVCSVEPHTLVTSDTSPDPAGLTVAAAMDNCASFDFGDMFTRLRGLQAPSIVVVVAANTAVTDRTSNGGVTYFYDTEILRLWRAARALYIPVCIVAPDELAIPAPLPGETRGVSIDDALARCGL